MLFIALLISEKSYFYAHFKFTVLHCDKDSIVYDKIQERG